MAILRNTLLLLLLQLTVSISGAGQDHPNVVLIAIDDLNDWASCMGSHPDARTPNIDRLADSGILYTNAYCTTAQCGPSRTAMLTGLDANTTGLYWNDDNWKQRFPGLISMPMHFRQAGYTVYGGGKIFHGNTPAEIRKYSFPMDWDEYFVPEDSPDPRINNVPIHPMEDVRPWVDWSPVDEPDEAMRDYKIASWAVEKIEQKHKKPFFIAVGFHKPHAPWYLPQKYFDARPKSEISKPLIKKDDWNDIPEGAKALTPNDPVDRRLRENGWTKDILQAYLAAVDFVDIQVGRVLDAVDASGLADDTIVIIWSDHGYNLGEKQHWQKHRLWERTTKTLLILRVPGETSPRTAYSGPVSSLDIYPTLAKLCNLPPRKHKWDGYDLSQTFTDSEWKRPRPALTTQAVDNYAIRSDRYRYIRYRDGSEELYDHSVDPNEWHNLAADPHYQKVKTELGQYIPTPETKAPRKMKDFWPVAKEVQARALAN